LDLARRVNKKSPVKVFTTKKQAGKALNKQLEENKTLAA
jgi:hypothetical protein